MGCGTVKTSEFDSDDNQDIKKIKINKKSNNIEDISFDNESSINNIKNENKNKKENENQSNSNHYKNDINSENNNIKKSPIKNESNKTNNESKNDMSKNINVSSIASPKNNQISNKAFLNNSSNINSSSFDSMKGSSYTNPNNSNTDSKNNIIPNITFPSNKTQKCEETQRHYYVEEEEEDDDEVSDEEKENFNTNSKKNVSSSTYKTHVSNNSKNLTKKNTIKSCTVLSPGQNKLAKLYIETNNSIEEYTSGGPFLEIEVKANRYDAIYPIFIPDNQEIEFQVSGKWNINSQINCDSKGILTKNFSSERKFNDGALVGRIIKGEEFLIYDGLKLNSKNRGALILKMFLNNFWSEDKPFGSLKLKIKGGEKIGSLTKLEEKIGWWKQLRLISYTNADQIKDFSLSSDEKNLIIIINKIRHDSSLFTSQYLNNYQFLTPSTIKIYKELMTNEKELIPLKVNLSVIKILNKFYGENLSNEKANYVQKSEKILYNCINECFKNRKKILVHIIKFYEIDPFNLALRLLFNEDVRKFLLDYSCEELSMIILDCQNENKSGYFGIFVLSNLQGNDNVSYDFDMNFDKFIEKEKKDEEEHLKLVDKIKKNIKN